MKGIGLIVLLFVVGELFAITPKEFIEKVNNNYSNLEDFEMNVRYQLYKEKVLPANLIEEEVGYVAKNSDGAYVNLFGLESIYNKDVNIILYHDYQEIIIGSRKEFSLDVFDVESNLRFTKDTKVKELENGNLILELDFDKIQNLPYHKLVIEIDNKFWIQSMVYHYNNQFDFSNSYFSVDSKFAIVKVMYENFKKKWKDKDEVLKIDRYVEFDKNIPISNRYNYKIIDYRK